MDQTKLDQNIDFDKLTDEELSKNLKTVEFEINSCKNTIRQFTSENCTFSIYNKIYFSKVPSKNKRKQRKIKTLYAKTIFN